MFLYPKYFVYEDVSDPRISVSFVSVPALFFSLPPPFPSSHTSSYTTGVENVDEDIVTLPPRRKDAPVVSRALLQNAILSAVVVSLGTLWVYSSLMLDGEVTKRDATMTFTTFVLFDLFNALSCRSQSKSIFEIGLFSNSTFLIAVGLSLLGQLLVIYFPPLQSVFHTEALALNDFMFIVVLSSAVFWIDEGRKLWAKGSLTRYCNRGGRGGGYSRVAVSERSFGERRTV